MNVDIQPSTPVKVAPPASDKATNKPQETGDEATPAFQQLLQGLRPQPEVVVPDAEVPAALPLAELPQEPEALDTAQWLQGTALEAEVRELDDADDQSTLPWEAATGQLDINSLVGQTLRLDQAGDAAVRAGTVALGQVGRGAHAAAQRAGMPGSAIATVAAGVEPLPNTVAPPTLHPATVGLGVADAPQAPVALAVAARGFELAVPAEGAQDSLPDLADGEGRVALDSTWQLEDPQAKLSPTLQRVLGQVEQWAMANGGLQTKQQERNARQAAGNELESAQGLVGGSSSGTRLTDQAVREAQQTDHAMNDAAPEAPVEDMRFWLQGKQQRAELMLNRDGEAVRVQVAVNGNTAHVTLLSDQATTRERLDGSLSQLRDMLAQQGVELMEVSVQAEPQGNSASSQGQGGQRQPGDGRNTPFAGLEGAGGRVRHAQVAVPVAGGMGRATSGIDLYA